MKQERSHYYIFSAVSIASIIAAGLAIGAIASTALASEIQPTSDDETNSVIAYFSGLIIYLLSFVPVTSYLLSRGLYSLLGRRYTQLTAQPDHVYVLIYSITAGVMGLLYTAYSTLLSLDFGFSIATLIFSLMLVAAAFVWFSANAVVATAVIKFANLLLSKKKAATVSRVSYR